MAIGAILTGLSVLSGAFNAVKAVAALTGDSSASASAPASSSARKADSVSLSKGALLKASQEKFLDGAAKDGVITLEELRSFRDKKLLEAGSALTNTLTRLGIPRNATLGISVNPDNSVTVTGSLGAADKQKLEGALAADKDFIQAYNAASGTASVITAAEASADFTGMYAQNAKEAVARYSSLFDRKWEQKMTFQNGVAALRKA